MTLILGIETSCDETAAAVVEDGRRIRSNVIATQIDLHRQYGGVFPEMASRQHILTITPVVEQALNDAGVSYDDLHAIAVTYGPGLAGSLLVGVNFAKGVAWGRDLPLIGVNHLEGHIYANWVIPPNLPADQPPPPAPTFPLLTLIVSGGHSELVLVSGHGRYRPLGRTIDDAAGEAFDKVARLLNLGYPGGPAIERAARAGNPKAFDMPRAWLTGTFDFSFSGLKTAVLRLVDTLGAGADRVKQGGALPRLGQAAAQAAAGDLPIADLAASFQAAIVEVLVEKTRHAAAYYGAQLVLLAGGVAANGALRQAMTERLPVPVRFPPPALCTDNAAPIASAGYFRYLAGERAGLDLDVVASLKLPVE
jgi:N6-L-threonylcarbamoyladenine synthase